MKITYTDTAAAAAGCSNSNSQEASSLPLQQAHCSPNACTCGADYRHRC